MSSLPPPPAPPSEPPPGYLGAPAFAGSPAEYRPGIRPFAGFWIRFIAYVIDSVAVAIAGGLGALVVGLLGSVIGFFHVLYVPLYAALIAYFPYMWRTWGASIGQMALGLTVVDEQTGGRLSVGASIIRYVGLIISAIPLYLGLMWAGWDSRKQGWHDKMAHSLVLRT